MFLRLQDGDLMITSGLATGRFRTDNAGAQAELAMAVDENERIEHFHPLADGSALPNIATYRNLTIVDRRQATIGPLAGFLSEGWHPVANSGTPELGFHALSQQLPRQSG
ncbi:hypothetical protein [Catelliglobosispora koreensis]|uniref:hypothetical protein n=1 Tax=Catelliglobosispora koreensis TaxID=129052 RepID=UPI00036678B5|nr:hypothetical protein [Catelliglobosispora koreensis]